MSVEHELGELRGELTGLKEEQRRLNASVKEMNNCFYHFTQKFPEILDKKVEGKVGWVRYIWITGTLIAILSTIVGLTWDMAERADHRSQRNEVRIYTLEAVHPTIEDTP